MKNILKHISPFIFLIIPFFIAVVLLAFFSTAGVVEEKIQLSASFIELPKFNIWHVFFR